MNTEVTPGKRGIGIRIAWFLAATLLIAAGLFLLIGPITALATESGLVWTLPFAGMGTLYLFSGSKVLIRESGLMPGLSIRATLGWTFILTSCVSLIGAIGAFFFWAISRSSWIHEGGDPSDMPPGSWIAAIVFAVVSLSSLALTHFTMRMTEKVASLPPEGSGS